jgi:hypothetical protein
VLFLASVLLLSACKPKPGSVRNKKTYAFASEANIVLVVSQAPAFVPAREWGSADIVLPALAVVPDTAYSIVYL